MKKILSRSLIALVFCYAPFLQSHTFAATANLFQVQSEWIDDHNNHVSLANFQGKETIVTMAYSRCKKICTLTLHKLKEIQALADKNKTPIDIIVVTLDPTTDNPETWRDYKKANKIDRNNWHFLTGNDADTKALANYLGVEYWSDEGHIMHDFKIIKYSKAGLPVHFLDWDNRLAASLF